MTQRVKVITKVPTERNNLGSQELTDIGPTDEEPAGVYT